jgi:hypothetical protein
VRHSCTYGLLLTDNYHMSSDTEATIASIRLECHTRVAILEQRLMDTANELGKAQVRCIYSVYIMCVLCIYCN